MTNITTKVLELMAGNTEALVAACEQHWFHCDDRECAVMDLDPTTISQVVTSFLSAVTIKLGTGEETVDYTPIREAVVYYLEDNNAELVDGVMEA